MPRHLVIAGAGYIGLEMGQFYRRMGAEVTIVGADAQIAEHEDNDVAQALQQLLEQEGIHFILGAHVQAVHKAGNGIQVAVKQTDNGQQQVIAATDLFIATGRQPNTDDLGLETVGINIDDEGVVQVDERLMTSVPGIWAVGDIRGGPMFTNTSWDDHRIVESQMVGDKSRTTQRVVPYALFTDPQLGRVGMTEIEARKKGKRIRVTHFAMKHNGKARETGATEGFIKVVIGEESDQILGAAVLANEAAELVHIYIALMNANAPASVLESAIQIHPTLAEAVQSAVTAQ